MKKIAVLSENIRDFKRYIEETSPEMNATKRRDLYVFVDINSYYLDQIMGHQFSMVVFTNRRIAYLYNLILTLDRRIVT